MSNTNFRDAFRKGLKVAESKDKFRKEIFLLIELMISQVKEESEDKIIIKIVKEDKYADIKNEFGAIGLDQKWLTPDCNVTTLNDFKKSSITRGGLGTTVDYLREQQRIRNFTAHRRGYQVIERSQDNLNYVLYVSHEKYLFQITELLLAPEGYPCRIKIDGNTVLSYDSKSFESNLLKLLLSAYVGDCFRKIIIASNQPS